MHSPHLIALLPEAPAAQEAACPQPLVTAFLDQDGPLAPDSPVLRPSASLYTEQPRFPRLRRFSGNLNPEGGDHCHRGEGCSRRVWNLGRKDWSGARGGWGGGQSSGEQKLGPARKAAVVAWKQTLKAWLGYLPAQHRAGLIKGNPTRARQATQKSEQNGGTVKLGGSPEHSPCKGQSPKVATVPMQKRDPQGPNCLIFKRSQ